MKALVFVLAMVSATQAFAISTPLQISKSTINLALASLSLDGNSKIVSVKNLNPNMVEVSFVDVEGRCFAQDVPIQFDKQGLPVVPERALPPVKLCK